MSLDIAEYEWIQVEAGSRMTRKEMVNDLYVAERKTFNKKPGII